MLSLQEIIEFRKTLDSARHQITGRTQAYNLVALYQALDREEELARVPAIAPAKRKKP